VTLPASGAISLLGNIRTELGLSGALNLEAASVRGLLGIASGAINMKAGYGKSNKPTYRPNAVSYISYTSAACVSNIANAWDGDSNTYGGLFGSLNGLAWGTIGLHGFPAIAFTGTLYVKCTISGSQVNNSYNSGTVSAGTSGGGVFPGTAGLSYGDVTGGSYSGTWACPISTSNLSTLYVLFAVEPDGKGDCGSIIIYDVYCQ